MPQDRRLWVRPKSNPLEKAEDEPEDAPFPKQVSDPPLGGKPPCGTLFERASVWSWRRHGRAGSYLFDEAAEMMATSSFQPNRSRLPWSAIARMSFGNQSASTAAGMAA